MWSLQIVGKYRVGGKKVYKVKLNISLQPPLWVWLWPYLPRTSGLYFAPLLFCKPSQFFWNDFYWWIDPPVLIQSEGFAWWLCVRDCSRFTIWPNCFYNEVSVVQLFERTCLRSFADATQRVSRKTHWGDEVESAACSQVSQQDFKLCVCVCDMTGWIYNLLTFCFFLWYECDIWNPKQTILKRHFTLET